MRCFFKEVLGITVNTTCLTSVTACYTDNGAKDYYYDIIICKWISNGTDYYDTSATASTCKGINYWYFESTAYIPKYHISPTNDQEMIKKYIGSSAGCTR